MISGIRLHPSRCAICYTAGNATELYPANLDFEAFNPAVFSARRLPDRIHYRIVRCNSCGLVRSDPVADPDLLAQLYARSTLDYADELPGLQATYGRYLAKLDAYGVGKGALLEVGCGNGFFLEVALVHGYESVRGVEPGAAAVEQASPHIRPYLVCDMMRPGLFDPASFDVICLFQVFDHIPDPAVLLDECSRVLKPGGMVLCLNHNVEALSARLLGERSPIIDVEHTYLYGPATLRRIFEVHGLRVRHVGPVANTYSLHYLARLVPLPGRLKSATLAFLKSSPLGRSRLSVPLGNMVLYGQK